MAGHGPACRPAGPLARTLRRGSRRPARQRDVVPVRLRRRDRRPTARCAQQGGGLLMPVEPPNIEQLRKSLASGLMYPGPMQDAASFLLSLVDEGGRLVVE